MLTGPLVFQNAELVFVLIGPLVFQNAELVFVLTGSLVFQNAELVFVLTGSLVFQNAELVFVLTVSLVFQNAELEALAGTETMSHSTKVMHASRRLLEMAEETQFINYSKDKVLAAIVLERRGKYIVAGLGTGRLRHFRN